jgi:GntR family transcriptional repressor for pyruvate dehydrogenase complex
MELSFQKVKTRRVFEEICEQIRQRLADGRLKPGDKLPSERELAVEFMVSRPAVREALRTLEISGVVSLQKGVKGGAFIRDGNPMLLTQSLQDLTLLGRVSVKSLAEARTLISSGVVELACERATEEDIKALEDNVKRLEATEDLNERAALGVEFFRILAEATRNEVLVMLMDSLGEIVRFMVDRVGRKARPELVPVRLRMIKALRARDQKAAVKAVREFLAILHDGMNAVEAAPALSAAARPAARPAPARAAPAPRKVANAR